MKITAISDDKEYIVALLRVDELMYNVVPGTKAGDELEYLLKLVEKYEDDNFPFEELEDIAPLSAEREKFRNSLKSQFSGKK